MIADDLVIAKIPLFATVMTFDGWNLPQEHVRCAVKRLILTCGKRDGEFTWRWNPSYHLLINSALTTEMYLYRRCQYFWDCQWLGENPWSEWLCTCSWGRFQPSKAMTVGKRGYFGNHKVISYHLQLTRGAQPPRQLFIYLLNDINSLWSEFTKGIIALAVGYF